MIVSPEFPAVELSVTTPVARRRLSASVFEVVVGI